MCEVVENTPALISKQYEKIIAKNLEKLLKENGKGQRWLADQLHKNGLTVNQGTISKYINNKCGIPLSVAVELCQIFDVSIQNLVDEHFLDGGSNQTCDADSLEGYCSKDPGLIISDLGDKFITNPEDEAFSGYLQTYYCYFFPTISQEKNILQGVLELKAEASYCRAILRLNTNKKKNGEVVWKKYTGYVIISKAVEACYILLSSPKEGELCVINLRHFCIRHQDLDCRMAEVITNGAGERHFPTVHRLLLSRVPICEEHLIFLAPHLHLNSSNIYIKKEELQKFKNENEAYQAVIENIIHGIKPVETYEFKESYIVSNAKQFLSRDETRLFLSAIRHISYKMRYNKVSTKLDETVRDTLLSFGYYQNPEE